MQKIDFSPMKETLDNILLQLVIWLGMSAVAYIVVYFILRLLRIPRGICHFISVIVCLIVMYYTLMNGYIPGFT